MMDSEPVKPLVQLQFRDSSPVYHPSDSSSDKDAFSKSSVDDCINLNTLNKRKLQEILLCSCTIQGKYVLHYKN
jgi:hypothetical protein